ncbi:hypothetical protein [Streptomyces flavofungini]|uniref:hypothetical protein n=1 Tax=Streptomyces flavofungini TaxID=68200 RepID=UPI0025B21175|nr:hypothetical protein [Streptomyces flavofungini]WJV47522.1 hypothetical protein QUY26_19510 [Streptomyces flavofungini]
MRYTTTVLGGLASLIAEAGLAMYRPDGVYAASEVGVLFSVAPHAPDGVIALTAYPVEDANGDAVPTSYELDGNDIVQTVETNDKTAFPVVADPKFTWGIVTGTVYFKKSETSKIANTGAAAALVGWALPPGLNAYVSAHAAAITKVAMRAKANKRCIKIKIAGGLFVPGDYSGGYCK